MATNQEEKPSLEEIFRDYCWRYFELHAEQRLKTFHFFIILSTTIVGGFLLLFRFGQLHKWVALLGFLLAFLAFVFWQLDVRNRVLVKNGEDALKFLDIQHKLPDIDGAPHPLRIFARDDHFTDKSLRLPLVNRYFSYSRCFKYMFVMFALIGICGGIASLLFLPV